MNLLRAAALVLLVAACSTAVRPPMVLVTEVVIRDVNVVDVVAGRIVSHTDVMFLHGRIVRVSAHDSTERFARDTRVVNASGRFLIPGLWDMHVHALWSTEALHTFLPLFCLPGRHQRP